MSSKTIDPPQQNYSMNMSFDAAAILELHGTEKVVNIKLTSSIDSLSAIFHFYPTGIHVH